jgi:hypothetical protein
MIINKNLYEAQMKSLLVDIKEKECHERLYRLYALKDVLDSAIWPNKGNMKPRDEGAYGSLQI